MVSIAFEMPGPEEDDTNRHSHIAAFASLNAFTPEIVEKIALAARDLEISPRR